MKRKLIPLTWDALAIYFKCSKEELTMDKLCHLTGCAVVEPKKSITILGVYLHTMNKSFDLNFSTIPREGEWVTVMKDEDVNPNTKILVPDFD